MNHSSGLSVPAFSDAVRLAHDFAGEPSAVRPPDPRLADDNEGGGTLHVDSGGCIRACSIGAATLFGREPEELVGEPIWNFVPALEGRRLLYDSRVDPHLGFLCHCGIAFRVLQPGGETIPCRLFAQSGADNGQPHLRLILRANALRSGICL